MHCQFNWMYISLQIIKDAANYQHEIGRSTTLSQFISARVTEHVRWCNDTKPNQAIDNTTCAWIVWLMKIIWIKQRWQVANYQHRSANSRTLTSKINIKNNFSVDKHHSLHSIITFIHNHYYVFETIRQEHLFITS